MSEITIAPDGTITLFKAVCWYDEWVSPVFSSEHEAIDSFLSHFAELHAVVFIETITKT